MAAVTDVNYALTLAPDEHARELRRAVVAATVGTTIEWYDFLLYSTMAGLVFGKLFFPNEDPLTATLSAFGIYFIGFVARPIGAFIFGHYGDRIGRKSTLIVTLMLMGVSTFLVAFLPGYAVIGVWGAVLLTILRLIQGIGVGGEWGGSVLLSMEWARHNHERGFLASWPQFGGPAGLVPRQSCGAGLQPYGRAMQFLVLGLAHSVALCDRPGRHRPVDPAAHPGNAGVPQSRQRAQDRAGADHRSVPQAMGHHHPRQRWRAPRSRARSTSSPPSSSPMAPRCCMRRATCCWRACSGRCCCRPSPSRSAAICPT